MPLSTHSNDYVFGRGELYVDLIDSNGATVGERFLGNCPGFTLSVESEQFEHFSSTSGIRSKDLTVTQSVDFSAQIQCDDVSSANLALFLGGAVGSKAQVATPVANEPHTVKQGLEYQLGTSSSNPTGVRDVGSVVVTNVAGSTTYVLDTDYRLNATLGRIYIIPGGAIADDQVIHVDYTPVAGSRVQVTSGNAGRLTAAVRFLAANANGTNRDLYIASASLSPEGELPLITEDELASFTLNVGVSEKNSQTAAIIIDGRHVAS